MKYIWIFFGVLLCIHATEQPQFFTTTTTVVKDETRMIPIQIGTAATTDISTHVTSSSDCITILDQPTILKEHKLGYIRIKGNKVGKSTLQIDNGSSIEIEVKLFVRKTSDQVKIITPISHSVIYGKCILAVDVKKKSTPMQEISIHIAEFIIVSHRSLEMQNRRRYFFTIDSEKLSPGYSEAYAKVTYQNEISIQSSPIVLFIPSHGKIVKKGECEEENIEAALPRFQKNKKLAIGSNPEASNGHFVFCTASYSSWNFSYNAKQNGLFQLFIRARGDQALETFPVIFVYVNKNPEPKTFGRIVHHNWQRVALGKPFLLEKGNNIISLVFANDFYKTKWLDRNLALDKYELVSVYDQSSQDISANITMTPMMQSQNEIDMQNSEMNSTEKTKPEIAQQFDKYIEIIFDTIFHNKTRSGYNILRARCLTSSKIPPEVTLWINGKPIYKQNSFDIFFPIVPAALQQGKNEIYLTAQVPGGKSYKSITQILKNPQKTEQKIAQFYRFSMLDSNWEQNFKIISRQKRKIAFLATNQNLSLEIPSQIEGQYNIFLDACGQNFKGPAIASVSMQKQNFQKVILRNNWSLVKAGTISLAKGKKTVQVSFTNDAYEEGVGDRNMMLGSVILQESIPDNTPPSVEILYPTSDELMYGNDVVIARILDDEIINFADIFIDGRPQNIHLNQPLKAEYYVFHLPLRNISPGKHSISIRATDQSSNIGESAQITISVHDKTVTNGTRYERAVALLNRFGYGPEVKHLAKLLIEGEKHWLSQMLKQKRNVVDNLLIRRVNEDIPRTGPYAIKQRTMRHLIFSPNPVHTRFVMWAQNHFSTWIRKVGGIAKWKEHVSFYNEGVSDFQNLLMLSATSPSMLIYLDQTRSFSNQINENYAREIMELHTLGVNGGYTQKDVTALAHLLTGWTSTIVGNYREQQHRFEPLLNNSKAQTILGVHFARCSQKQKQDRIFRIIEILATHPSTAKFISQKLVEHYVATPAPKKLVDDMTIVFMETHGNFVQILQELSQHPIFWEHALKQIKFTTPQDYAMRLFRCLGIQNQGLANRYLESSGMGLFEHPTPDGYSETTQDYIGSNMLLERWNLTNDLRYQIFQKIPTPWRRFSSIANDQLRSDIIDIITMRINGRILNAKYMKAALQILDQDNKNDREKLLAAITFITKLPQISFK